MAARCNGDEPENRSEGKEDAIDAFLDEICRRSGLLIPKGEDQFAFTHLSFQEYFAALLLLQQFKLPDRKRKRGEGIAGAAPDDLEDYVDQRSWTETLVLLAELTAVDPRQSPAQPTCAIVELVQGVDRSETAP